MTDDMMMDPQTDAEETTEAPAEVVVPADEAPATDDSVSSEPTEEAA